MPTPRPIASSAVQPKSRSAAGFQAAIMPSASIATNASCAVSTTMRVRSSARRTSLTSTMIPWVWVGSPASSKTICSRSHTQSSEPSAAISRYSHSNGSTAS
jgi:hypothetical protein